jgi:hypothetical protein
MDFRDAPFRLLIASAIMYMAKTFTTIRSAIKLVVFMSVAVSLGYFPVGEVDGEV